MATLRITTPVPDYSGSVGGVHFSGGQALADTEIHAAELDYFRARGYGVHDAAEPADEPVDDDAEPDGDEEPDGGSGEEPAEPKPAKSASKAAWQAWAVEHGGMSEEDAASMTRDQLVERFTGSEDLT